MALTAVPESESIQQQASHELFDRRTNVTELEQSKLLQWGKGWLRQSVIEPLLPRLRESKVTWTFSHDG